MGRRPHFTGSREKLVSDGEAKLAELQWPEELIAWEFGYDDDGRWSDELARAAREAAFAKAAAKMSAAQADQAWDRFSALPDDATIGFADVPWPTLEAVTLALRANDPKTLPSFVARVLEDAHDDARRGAVEQERRLRARAAEKRQAGVAGMFGAG